MPGLRLATCARFSRCLLAACPCCLYTPLNQVLAINNAAIQRLLLALPHTHTHAQPLLAAASTPCLLLPSPFPHSLSLSRHFWQFVQNQSSATNAMQQQEQLTRHNCHIRQRQQRRRRRRRDVDVSANDDARLLQKSTPKKCSITKKSHEPIQVRAYVMLVLLLASCRERGYDATIETKKRIGGAVRKGMERFGIWHTALPDCATRGAPSVGAATHQTICMRCDSTGRDFVAQIK